LEEWRVLLEEHLSQHRSLGAGDDVAGSPVALPHAAHERQDPAAPAAAEPRELLELVPGDGDVEVEGVGQSLGQLQEEAVGLRRGRDLGELEHQSGEILGEPGDGPVERGAILARGVGRGGLGGGGDAGRRDRVDDPQRVPPQDVRPEGGELVGVEDDDGGAGVRCPARQLKQEAALPDLPQPQQRDPGWGPAPEPLDGQEEIGEPIFSVDELRGVHRRAGSEHPANRRSKNTPEQDCSGSI